jgi:hypothetical protein
MDLSLFCDIYIIAEYFRLNSEYERLPRYKTGIHCGAPVIRKYTGFGSSLSRQDTHITGGNYAEMQKELELYEKRMSIKAAFREEIKRRHLAIPDNFKFIRDVSEFDVSMWEQLQACSNAHEVNTGYYDGYGFNVRSRGEMIVGNALKELGLEAKYEPALLLKGGRKRNPDYSFPVRIIDRCFFVEFMGMTDDDDYLENNYWKSDEYMRNGILPNRDLILISGTKNWIPTQESLKRKIAYFINDAVLSAYERKV